jgi:hypothetical protein
MGFGEEISNYNPSLIREFVSLRKPLHLGFVSRVCFRLMSLWPDRGEWVEPRSARCVELQRDICLLGSADSARGLSLRF